MITYQHRWHWRGAFRHPVCLSSGSGCASSTASVPAASYRNASDHRKHENGRANRSRTELVLTQQNIVGLENTHSQPPTNMAAPLVAILALGLSIAAIFVSAPIRAGFTNALPASIVSVTMAVRNRSEELPVLSGRGSAQVVAARKKNAAIPFSTERLVPSAPFLFAGTAQSRARAVDCLALAAMAEAGASAQGQRAVIQVILNRVRDPAFAKSICGVVFEGSDRATGCQFTFTCDGSLARRYSPDAWSRARARAADALNGQVFAEVGTATHYHTDWVHPYWSGTLVKLAQIDTHIFFRWPGRSGRGTHGSLYSVEEPAIALLAYLPAHSDAGEVALALTHTDSNGSSAAASTQKVVYNGDGGAFVLLEASQSAASASELARRICAGRQSCKVLGWFEGGALPSGYPVPARHRAQLAFSYFRGGRDEEIILFDCSKFFDVGPRDCLPRSMSRRSTAPTGMNVVEVKSSGQEGLNAGREATVKAAQT